LDVSSVRAEVDVGMATEVQFLFAEDQDGYAVLSKGVG
jgi:hypothetical protein